MKDYNHSINIFKGIFECGICHKTFPIYYRNKGHSYYGDRGRYNFRGAQANFNRHTNKCESRIIEKENEVRLSMQNSGVFREIGRKI